MLWTAFFEEKPNLASERRKDLFFKVFGDFSVDGLEEQEAG